MQIVEQRSDLWFEMRRCKITSSEIHKIMGGKEGALTETTKTYLLERAAQYFGGQAAPSNGAALEWGIELEDLALEVYQERTGIVATKCSFIEVNKHYGGSPDALVGTEGTVEIKCPFNSANHFKHGLITSDAEFYKAAPAYYYQCISHMICANAQWCDFISFDPRVQPEYGMFIYRLHRDEAEVENVKAKIEIAVKYMLEIIAKIEEAKSKQILSESKA